MKEYICKEDLDNVIMSDPYDTSFYYVSVGIRDIVNEFPTVTKADICREFAEKIFERFGHGKSLHDVIVDVLAEMESNE